MADSDDEIRPVASRELPASEPQNAAGVTSVVAAQIEIDRALALSTAMDEKRRRRREQAAARRARLAQDPVAAAAARERAAANRARRRKRLRDTDPEASASVQAEDTAAHAAARRRLQAGAAVAGAHGSAARADLRSRVAIDALSSDSEGSENDEETAGMEGTARPRGLCAAEIFSGVEGYDGISPPPLPGGSGWEPAVRLHGKLTHYAGPLLAAEGREASFLQAYFLDSEENGERLAAVCRAVAHGRGGQLGFGRIPVSELDTTSRGLFDAVQMLYGMLLRENNLVKQFLMARERVQEIEATTGRPVPSLRVVVHANAVSAGCHVRVYNDAASTNGEVAAVVPQSDLDVPSMPQGTGHSGELKRDVVLMVRAPPEGAAPQGILRKVSFMNSWFDPTRFPLLFPLGTDGWHDGIQKTRGGKKVSQLDFMAYHLFTREGQFAYLQRCKRLWGEYVVDQFIKVEHARLLWQRLNQKSLQCEMYSRVVDAFRDGSAATGRIGKGVLLHASHVASPRYMAENFADSMAVVRAFGKPALFGTFTCNPQWKEIQDALLPNQTPNGRPDLITRVFKMKLKELIKMIKEDNVFGYCLAFVMTIEFQKRGLPHAHWLVILRRQDVPQTADAYDKFIRAEIPKESDSPSLRAKVLKHMVHGPCGSHNFPKDLASATTATEDCYPNYRRRSPQDGGESVAFTRGNRASQIDNSWIVPYSPLLLEKFDCHINLEIVSSVAVVKYICKYIYKGPDKAMVSVVAATRDDEGGEEVGRQPRDEIQEYLDARWIAECEAVWRGLSNPVIFRDPAVMKMPVHLENQQPVFFAPGEVEGVAATAPKETKLTAFFSLMQAPDDGESPSTTDLLYADIPRYFTWQTETRKWRRRQRGVQRSSEDTPTMIGRVAGLHPSMGDVYYMRLFLYRVKGPGSFVDIRTYEGFVHPTYKDACAARQMLATNAVWDETLTEAASWKMPAALRELFASVVALNAPADVPDLLQKHYTALSEDMNYRLASRQAQGLDLDATEDDLRRIVLLDIEKHMRARNSCLQDHQILIPAARVGEDGEALEVLGEAPPPARRAGGQALAEQLPGNRDELLAAVAHRVPTLQPDQKVVWDAVSESMDGSMGRLFFLDAPGGAGKTYLAETLLNYTRGSGHIGLAVASSAIAATLMPLGRTAHSRFKIPIEINQTSFCGFTQSTDVAKMLKKTKLIVWDEASMAHRHCFEAVDRSIVDVMGPDVASQITWLVCGDFRQVPAVVPKGSIAEIIRASLRKSPLMWSRFTRMQLTTNMRVKTRADAGQAEEASLFEAFGKWLLAIGDGVIRSAVVLQTEESARGTPAQGFDLETDLRAALPLASGQGGARRRSPRPGSTAAEQCTTKIRIPRAMCLPKGSGMQELLNSVFPEMSTVNPTNAAALDAMGERMILTTLNKDVLDLNELAIDQFPGQARTYYSIDTVSDEDMELAEVYTTEFLNTIDHSSVPTHAMVLKVGMTVMLLRNLAAQNGDCNGTRYIVTRLGDNVIELRQIGTNRRILIPKIDVTTSDCGLPIKLKRRQFPIRVAFAATINKAQGATLKRLGLWLPQPVFGHGQVYVGTSRVGDPREVIVGAPAAYYDDAGYIVTNNVVFTQLLNDDAV
ncbi:hypothetical protein BU14_0071s0050 [Porphyra umbilicalis]|uniref:ATP-dependent DNA helicase n=1 Tax=Porphyra umbilicalis TaxID=2786 RepID=A0A1X6PGC3_PORUM|nr:hypothetical protein BU14_0071s0050 [Porphyra umbilicalis]|eukprot:OSX79796.1 hypothetical protein BU14_0071s0050 [Porphyra umbilicalis]